MPVTPNQLTVLRIILTLLSILCFLQLNFIFRIAAGLLAFAAGITDYWDGYLARKHGLVTTSGKILDPIADKLFVLGMMGVFSYLGLYSFLCVLPILIREVLITAIRINLLMKGRVIHAERSGKTKMIFQIVSLSATFLYLIERDYARTFFEFWNQGFSVVFISLNYGFIALAVILTLYSGYEFLKSNWRYLFEK